jgi:hypothetical protein
VLAGLVIGKPLGIMAAAFLGVKSGIAKLPATLGWIPLLGYASLAGIGFTMSLFIAMLAFDGTASVDAAKQGILAGSLLAGVAGATILRAARHYRDGQQITYHAWVTCTLAEFPYQSAGPNSLGYFISVWRGMLHRCRIEIL